MKKLIYTANIGSYDKIRNPIYIDTDNFDYICFTDNPDNCLGTIWTPAIIPIRLHIDDPYFQAKHVKMFPGQYAPDHKESVWMDANIVPSGDLMPFFNEQFQGDQMAFIAHPYRNCIYKECQEVVNRGKESEDNANAVANFLAEENYPPDNGMIMGGVLFRRHTNLVEDTMKDWWALINKLSRRDQLTFNLIAWKHKLKFKTYPHDTFNYYFKMHSDHV